MSDPEPIDLSQLQNLNLAPDWVGDLQKRETAPGEVVWGRAPDHERESRGGGQGQGYGGAGGGRGPRRDAGGFGGRPDFNRPGPGGPPRGPRQDDRGPRPGGPGGFGGPRPGGPGGFGGPPRGPRQDDRGPRPQGPQGPGGPRPEGPRGPRPDRPAGDRPQGDRGPRPDDRNAPPRGPGGDRRGGPGGRPEFRRDDRRDDRRGGPPGRFDDRPQIEPLPGWRVRLFAEPKSLEAIVRQVKASSRAYPVFEMGRLFLAGRDRYLVNFSRLQAAQHAARGPKGAPAPEPTPPPGGPDELFHVPSDGSLWTTKEEAIRHLLSGPALQNHYRREVLTIDPPKGNFTAVAVCGFSGTILGPPNHHSFQTTVARLHREQFYNLPIDRYKSRIRVEKDEALVAKWLEEQSTTVVFVPLTAEEIAAAQAARDAAQAAAAAKSPAPEASRDSSEAPADSAEGPTGTAEATPEPTQTATDSSEAAAESAPALETTAETSAADAPEVDAAPAEAAPEAEAATVVDTSAEATPAALPDAPATPVEPLKSHAAMEAHFIEHHAPHLLKTVTRISVPGNIPGKLLSPPLLALLRMEVEQQQRFPMQFVQDLCRDLEKENLKFFKRDKKATFVCRTRPHYIEDESHLSPRLRSIVGVVKANPGITVPKLVSVLAPHAEAPAPKTPPATAEAAGPLPVVTPPAETVLTPEVPTTVESSAGLTPEIAPDADSEPSSSTVAPDAETTADSATDSTPLAEMANEAPTAEVPPAETTAPEAPAPEEASALPSAEIPVPETSTPAPKDARREEGRNRRPKGPKAPPAPPAPPAPLTAEEIGVLQDLRWLVQEGFVTEYASGELQILGRPPQPPAEKKPRAEPKAETVPASTGDEAIPPPSATESTTSTDGETAGEVPTPAEIEPSAELEALEAPEAMSDSGVVAEEAAISVPETSGKESDPSPAAGESPVE